MTQDVGASPGDPKGGGALAELREVVTELQAYLRESALGEAANALSAAAQAGADHYKKLTGWLQTPEGLHFVRGLASLHEWHDSPERVVVHRWIEQYGDLPELQSRGLWDAIQLHRETGGGRPSLDALPADPPPSDPKLEYPRLGDGKPPIEGIEAINASLLLAVLLRAFRRRPPSAEDE